MLLFSRSARCVQNFDDSRSAVRITYRISLRSSSSQEPRYPLLKVVKRWLSCTVRLAAAQACDFPRIDCVVVEFEM